MQDPLPENIDGQKVHVVRHELQWGYLVWGAVALLILALFWSRIEGGESDDEAHESL